MHYALLLVLQKASTTSECVRFHYKNHIYLTNTNINVVCFDTEVILKYLKDESGHILCFFLSVNSTKRPSVYPKPDKACSPVFNSSIVVENQIRY